MYVCDRDLRSLLPSIAVAVEEGAEPFDAESQIQPASIDFRLSAVFWKPVKKSPIDLRRSRLLELNPRRYYRKRTLGSGESITVRPGEMLLARTAEEFAVPNGYACELVGRSSFARLGLMVTATGSYINPGWRGRMPLQLVNFGPNPIRVVPYLPICQVRFIPLTDHAERPYGDPALGSIYVDDDGGPSYWWRDKRIQRLHDTLAKNSVHERTQRALYERIGQREPEVIERLEKRIATSRIKDLQNCDSILDDFSASEEKRRTLRRWTINILRGLFTVGFAAILGSLWKLPPLHWWHFVIWVAAALLISVSIAAYKTEVGEHFGEAELRASLPK